MSAAPARWPVRRIPTAPTANSSSASATPASSTVSTPCGARSRAAWNMSTRCPSASRRASPARSSRRRSHSEVTPRPATLITGASAGLGAEFARQCARRGEEVVLVARREDRLEALAAEIGKAHVIVADLAEPGAATRVVAEVISRGMWVKTLINNAGFGLTGRFDALTLARQLEMIDLNIRALTNLSYVVINDMVLKGGGA